jgi:hypothetical protein
MGAVWLADHVGLAVPCAVKFIHGRALDRPVARARFEREAKAAATLRSPNVVQILDYGVWQDVPYLAMEYLQGETLSARLERQGRLGPEETVHIVAQIGRALGKAHRLGIVHRDLKPENIFLVADDEEEVAKILDFGVAKDSGGLGSAPGNTKTGALLGTPVYMSPEQAQGAREADWRADLWALAVVAYRCVVGELPFYDEALVDLLLLICTGPLPVPSQHADGVPAAFDAWWARAAAREPDARFQSARELVEALASSLGVPLVVGPSLPDEDVAPPRRAEVSAETASLSELAATVEASTQALRTPVAVAAPAATPANVPPMVPWPPLPATAGTLTAATHAVPQRRSRPLAAVGLAVAAVSLALVAGLVGWTLRRPATAAAPAATALPGDALSGSAAAPREEHAPADGTPSLATDRAASASAGTGVATEAASGNDEAPDAGGGHEAAGQPQSRTAAVAPKSGPSAARDTGSASARVPAHATSRVGF